MLLNFRIKCRKLILAIYAKVYGINHENTQKQSKKLDVLVNEYYERHR